jgi:hypothetical protein
LAALDEALLQSLATWPGLPQNMQSLFSKRRWRSSFVSLPSRPNFDERSEVGAGLSLGSLPFDALLPENVDEVEVGVEGFVDLKEGLSTFRSTDLEEVVGLT